MIETAHPHISDRVTETREARNLRSPASGCAFHARLAQSVEQAAVNRQVGGSSPSPGALLRDSAKAST